MKPNQQNKEASKILSETLKLRIILKQPKETGKEIMVDKGRRVFRNNYKGHMDKTKGRWKQGREGVNADNCT